MSLGGIPMVTVVLLLLSNLFMTVAWYGHLRFAGQQAWWAVALASWGIACFEYLLQVPANRIGYAAGTSVAQLRVTQEVLSLAVFVPFSVWVLHEPLKWDYLWAALCLVGAVYFIFRS